VGHSSTSISAGLGAAVAAEREGLGRRTVCVIGDGAITAGMAFEAMNHAGDIKSDMLVVLNDNEMSISENVGALMIRAAVRMGALAAGEKGRAALPLLDSYAEAIGLAFQVQDDILDVIGDTATLGKRQGADQQLGKSTYPALLGLEGAQAKAKDLYQEAVAALEQLAANSYNTAPLLALARFVIERDN